MEKIELINQIIFEMKTLENQLIISKGQHDISDRKCRVQTIKLEKLFLEFRKLSIALSKERKRITKI